MRLNSMEQGRRLLDSMSKTSDSGCRMKLRNEAIACIQRGLRVTHDIEKSCISALKKVGITVIVSPYEADAQLAYLCNLGMCKAVLTEDSDLITYSAICGTPFPILYKFESSGMVQAVSLRTLNIRDNKEEPTLPPSSDPIPLESATVTHTDAHESEAGRTMFISSLQRYFSGPRRRRLLVQLCVLAGCDYCDPIEGVSLLYAMQLCILYKDSSDDSRLVHIVRHLENAGYSIRSGYLERAIRVEALFYYHPVYDPLSKTIKNFTNPNIMSCCNGRSPPSSPPASQASSPNAIAANRTPGSAAAPKKQTCRNPLVDLADLLRLGTEEDILTSSAPPGVTLQDICEGNCSYQDFSRIEPMLPWERPEVRALSNHESRRGGGGSGGAVVSGHGPRGRNSCWLNRSNLMKMLSTMDSGGGVPAGRSLKKLTPSFPATQSTFTAPVPARREGSEIPSIESTTSANASSHTSPTSRRRSLDHVSVPAPVQDADGGRVLSNMYGNFHTPPSNGDSCTTASAVEVLSPQINRLASEESTSPVLSAPRRHSRLFVDKTSRPPDRLSDSAPDEQIIVATKRKPLDAVAVPITGAKSAAKGKKQKTLMVASIKSYFSTPR